MALARSTEDVKKKSVRRVASLPTMLPSELEEKGKAGPILPMDIAKCNDGTEKAPVKLLEIEEKVEDVITQERKTALFECKVVQSLTITCTWYKDGNILQNDERITITEDGAWRRLEIKNVTATDQGIYTIECQLDENYITEKGHLYVAPRGLNDGVFYNKIQYHGNGIIKHLNNLKVIKGEKIELEASLRFESEMFFWYRNNELLSNDSRTTINNSSKVAMLTILDAKSSDTGVYYIVVKTQFGFMSSFSDVEVGDKNEKRQPLPIIEEGLPEEIEALVGEETRLMIKAHTDTDTNIKWLKNNVEIKTIDYEKYDYGNNYIGLTIPHTTNNMGGEYRVTLMNDEFQRVVYSTTRLTVTTPPRPPPEVDLIRPLESAVACCGSELTFDCCFDLEDSTYFYVVWYVGHYKVERTNSLFNVICSGGQFLLHIKKFEPGMAGEVICELRRAWPKRKSVMLRRAYANLVMVPLAIIDGEKIRPVLDGKLYHVQDSPDIDIRIEANKKDTRSLPEITNEGEVSNNDFLLKVIFCRLDDKGLYFLNVTRELGTMPTTNLVVYEIPDALTGNSTIVIEWNDSLVPSKHWYGIELGQANGSFTEAGVTSNPFFEVEGPPMDRMMVFRIKAVEPLNRALDSEIYIVPPPEIIPRLAIPHEIQPMEDFDEQYTKTEELIGCGAFGSVMLVRDNNDGAHYAAKTVKARVGKKRDNILREFHIMKNLHHPKLIELIGFYESRTSYVFVMEYCWGGELFDRVVCEEYLKELDVVGYVKQICQGLDYMHQNGIVHLDLKPENIICINPNSRQVKLIDFGVARNVNEEFPRAIYGTRDYVAPEVIDFEPITTASDMWSLGVVTYTLLSGVMPFGGDTWVQRSVNITRASYDYDDYAFNEVSDLAKDFVDHLLLRRPQDRMSATDALEHKWIQEGPPQGMKAKRMNKMRKNLKSYLADYRLRWQRAGNVMIAAHRLRARARHEPVSRGETPELTP